MKELINKVLGSLDKGNAVVIHGSSGAGKSTTMRALKEVLEQKGKRPIYLDMRHIKDSFQFLGEMSSQLGIDSNSQNRVYQELTKGDVALLFDEYWANSSFAHNILKTAHELGNHVVTAAGIPLGIKFDEYIMTKREKTIPSID